MSEPNVFFCDKCGYVLDREAFNEYYEFETNICNRCRAGEEGTLDELEVLQQENFLDDEDDEPEDDWDEDWEPQDDEDEEEAD